MRFLQLLLVLVASSASAFAGLDAAAVPQKLFAAIRLSDYAIVRDFEGRRGVSTYVINPGWLDEVAVILGRAKFTKKSPCFCDFYPLAEFYQGQDKLAVVSISFAGDAIIGLRDGAGYFEVDGAVARAIGALFLCQRYAPPRADSGTRSNLLIPLPPLPKFGLTRR